MQTQKRVYRADIDGLRAIAVMAVILFHLKRAPFLGGFVGVDVFFVISGFLITGILVRELDEGRFSILRFYERRARRIAPALFAVIIATLAVGYFLFLPGDLKNLGRSSVATIFMLANIFWWKDVDYFSAPPDTKPMLHMWSLGVEEQFYLFLPLILWCLTSRSLRRFRPHILAVLLISSFVACVIVTKRDASTAFFWLPFRAWELLVGGMLVFLPKSDKAPGSFVAVLSFVGFVAIMASILTLNKHSTFPGFNALAPALGSAAVIWAGSGRNPATNRFLSLAPLVWIGLISYSLYLWHWPIIVFLRYWLMDSLDHFAITVALVLTFVLATLSYGWIEQPFRVKKDISRRKIFTWTLSGAVALSAWALSYSTTQGLPQRIAPAARQYAEGHNDQGRFQSNCLTGNVPPKLEVNGPCRIGATDKKIDFVLWGDSFTASIAVGLEEHLKNSEHSGLLLAAPLCLPVLGTGGSWDKSQEQCTALQGKFLQAIDEIKPKMVILHANWQMLEFLNNYKWLKIEKKKTAWDTFQPAFAHTIDELKKRGLKIVIITAIPDFPVDVAKNLAQKVALGRPSEIFVSVDTMMRHNKIAYKLFSQYRDDADISFINPSDILCVDGQCRGELNGHSLYFDNWHLNAPGSRFVAPIFEKVFP